jgi:hypothetical protein
LIGLDISGAVGGTSFAEEVVPVFIFWQSYRLLAVDAPLAKTHTNEVIKGVDHERIDSSDE